MKYQGVGNFEHKKKGKIGVLLVNLGTPQAPTAKALRVYLREFLSDPRVVSIPRLIWFFILNLFVLTFRPKRSAEAYASIWQEGGSPLFLNSDKITQKLKAQLDDEVYQVELGMRYGQPSIDSVITKMQSDGVKQLLVLPLYPQYSATTTASTFDAVAKTFMQKRMLPELRFVNHYHDKPLYIEALAHSVKAHWEKHGKADKLMLSYHGIPKDYWDKGDPYICECYKTSRLLAEKLGLTKDEVITCFQSRFGKQEWVKPYTDATLKSLPSQGVKSLQIMCPGFSADCLETLEEIEEENKEYFMEAGGESYQYIPCLNDDEMHIEALKQIVHNHSQGWATNYDPNIDARVAELKQKNI